MTISKQVLDTIIEGTPSIMIRKDYQIHNFF